MSYYKVQTKTGPRAKWADDRMGYRFSTRDEALATARSWDQDGDFNPRAFRIVAVAA